MNQKYDLSEYVSVIATIEKADGNESVGSMWTETRSFSEKASLEEVLGTKEKVRSDGEVMELIPTTHDMDKFEFGQYIESASKFLAEFASIVVLSPDMFWEQPEKEKKRKAS